MVHSTAPAIVTMPPLFSSSSTSTEGLDAFGSQSDSDFDGFYDCEEGRGAGLGGVEQGGTEGLFSRASPVDTVDSSPLLQFRDKLLQRRR